MAIVNEARAVLTADDRASHVLAMVARNFDRLNRAADRVNAHVGNPRAQQKMQEATARTAVLTAGMGAAAMRAAGPLAGLLTVYGAGSGAFRANKAFADNERSMTRIAVTADASMEAQGLAWTQLQALARQTAQPVAKVREGLDALVASGRSLPEAMAFLPAVAQTAQASGAEVSDIAKTADAVGESFKISGDKMQNAFDIMAAGGKAGKFELKDMARYLPSLGPATAALGFKGEKGLADLVALLQTMRKGTGTAEEAVASMSNILNKMESDKTTKEFKKLGVDSEEAFKKARKEGRNLVEVFEELLQKATKGDASKIGEIIDDQEFKRGAVALMQFKGEWQKLSQTMQTSSAGTVATDLARVTANSQATFDRFKNSAERLADTIGKRLSPAFKGLADNAAAAMDAMDAALKPGETDQQRLERIGNVPRTRAEQSIENARLAQERQKKLDDPNSEYYGMVDGGFARRPGSLAPELRDDRKAPASVRVPRHLAMMEAARAARAARAADEERADYLQRQARRAAFIKGERAETAASAGMPGRADDTYRDVDALSRRRNTLHDDDVRASSDNMLVGHGQASRDAMAGLMNLAQIIRGGKMAEQGEANVFALGGEQAKQQATAVIEAAVRAIAERRSQETGKPVDEASIVATMAKLTALAERIGEAVPAMGPKGRIEGLPQAAEAIMNGKLTAEVKPDQITANANVNVAGDIGVKVEASPDLWAKIERKIITYSAPNNRGISLPGKETRSAGGGMAP
jgi:TP901 family phage tail tape measure protein